MPAVWLPYGSTSISIKIDHEDLAWVFPTRLNIGSPNYQELNNVLKTSSREGSLLLIDPTLPVQVKVFLRKSISENIMELVCFDMFNKDPSENLSFKSACLLSRPHLDPLIEFRGLGENLLPFYPTLWRDFKTNLLDASKSQGVLSLKNYLNDLEKQVDLKLIMLTPWAEDSILSTNNLIEAYEILNNFKEFLTAGLNPFVELLLVSAGGEPFDESLSRALSVFPNCLRDCECDRILLIAEGTEGLGLDPELFLKNISELEMPLILQYVALCKSLLKDKTVHFVSATPEPLLKMMIDCKAYETLLDAYKASRLFLPKGSKTGIITHAPFASVRLEKGFKMGGET
ncbi:MAG: hypothetical protein QXN75_05650 [Thermoproteota archaeon]|nr:hypothetical protein [Candidatus Brockarchaeota archaeon]